MCWCCCAFELLSSFVILSPLRECVSLRVPWCSKNSMGESRCRAVPGDLQSLVSEEVNSTFDKNSKRKKMETVMCSSWLELRCSQSFPTFQP